LFFFGRHSAAAYLERKALTAPVTGEDWFLTAGLLFALAVVWSWTKPQDEGKNLKPALRWRGLIFFILAWLAWGQTSRPLNFWLIPAAVTGTVFARRRTLVKILLWELAVGVTFIFAWPAKVSALTSGLYALPYLLGVLSRQFLLQAARRDVSPQHRQKWREWAYLALAGCLFTGIMAWDWPLLLTGALILPGYRRMWKAETPETAGWAQYRLLLVVPVVSGLLNWWWLGTVMVLAGVCRWSAPEGKPCPAVSFQEWHRSPVPTGE